jgi:hypothetical protein
MNKHLINTLDKLPYVSGLRAQIGRAGAFPAGHYYSPIPSKSDAARRLARKSDRRDVVDVDFRREGQFRLLQDFSQYYKDLPFTDEKSETCRYYFNQTWFGHTDAIILYSFIRHFAPRRIIEIGSGYSSAVMLDTLDRYSTPDREVTFIEPFPERLNALLSAPDRARVTLIEKMIQDVDFSTFQTLAAGDLLFVDSSHVMKFGSDLYTILFEILPILPIGIHVHFHDIFSSFEYPDEWVQEGRYWNECYLLRAFLASNRCWEITFFNDYANREFAEFIEHRMPLCRKSFGGSLYIKRVG